jgi:hypothetical protein
MKTFLVMLFFVTLTQAGEQKGKKVIPDSNSVLISRQFVIQSFVNQREQIKQKYISDDSFLAGEIEMLKSITSDSIYIRKELIK